MAWGIGLGCCELFASWKSWHWEILVQKPLPLGTNWLLNNSFSIHLHLKSRCSHEEDKVEDESTRHYCVLATFNQWSSCHKLIDSMKTSMFDQYLEMYALSYGKERGLHLKGTVKPKQLVCQGGRFPSRRGSVRTLWEPERCRALLQLRPGPHRFYSLFSKPSGVSLWLHTTPHRLCPKQCAPQKYAPTTDWCEVLTFSLFSSAL